MSTCFICNPGAWDAYPYQWTHDFKWTHSENLTEIILIIENYIRLKDHVIDTINHHHKTICSGIKLKAKMRSKRKAAEIGEEESGKKEKKRSDKMRKDDIEPKRPEEPERPAGPDGPDGPDEKNGRNEKDEFANLIVKILYRRKKPDEPIVSKWAEAVRLALKLTNYQYMALERLSGAIKEIKAINAMIGMVQIKHQFMSLLKFLTNVDQTKDTSFLMHMVISGPPGHGKTAIAQLLGKAFKQSGLLKNDIFITARRADLIGAYCGHTAKNTTAMFNKASGGVIFIDEVYSLGNKEKSDVFTKECIDTINQLLSERTDTLCIVAGYDAEIRENFFAYNKGLERRFPWRFTIEEYGPKELKLIFLKLLGEMDWKIAPDAILYTDFNKEHFANAGGDVANLITNCIIAHYHLNFLAVEPKMELCREDIERGLAAYMENKVRAKEKDPFSPPPPGMYN